VNETNTDGLKSILTTSCKQKSTSVEPRIVSRTGRSSRRTGRIWSSVRSALMNSVKTCIAPCTDSGEFEEIRLISEVKSSGYSSGQSQFAI
jgi:hypothetical protein